MPSSSVDVGDSTCSIQPWAQKAERGVSGSVMKARLWLLDERGIGRGSLLHNDIIVNDGAFRTVPDW